MSEDITIEQLNRMYQECAAGSEPPNMVYGSASFAKKYLLSKREVAAIEAFEQTHPGKNWHLDRKTLVVTELPDDDS